ncbi:MAG: 30S ribosome-binding factor RbfA [Dehalococcoidia bacterium]
MTRRMERLNELIRADLSDLILREVRDPRLGGLISITRVDTSPDLYTSRIFVSIMDEPKQQEIALRALNSAAAFFHRELKSRLQTRRVPFLSFQLDTSIAEGAEILALMNETSRNDVPPEPVKADSDDDDTD